MSKKGQKRKKGSRRFTRVSIGYKKAAGFSRHGNSASGSGAQFAMKTKKVFFRAERRDFKPGDAMPPADKDYISDLNKNHRAVEDLIRQSLPNGTTLRGATLHVFEDQHVAYNYWLPTAATGRHFYEVEVEVSDIRYCGDMALYNEAAEHLNNPPEMQRLVEDYCSGKRSPTPKIEVMVDKAVVRKRLHEASEGVALFRRKHFPNSDADFDMSKLFDNKKSGS